MNSEIRTCQNCKNPFTIESEDFAFYEKMKVPPPTWCPECRKQRRIVWRNERALYRRKCDAEGHEEEIISPYAPNAPYVVFDQKFWWSDGWDGLQYGQVYDFSKSFFEQFKELLRRTPLIALMNKNAVNSEYCNASVGNKNCYLVFGGDFNENLAYAGFAEHSRDSMELYWANKCELCYQVLDSISCFRLMFGRFCQNCSDSYFLYNCVNCSNCFGCTNLRNKSYYIFNRPYTKEEYYKKIKEIFDSGSFASFEEMKEKFKQIKSTSIHRFATIIMSTDVSGDIIYNSRNCQNCFEVFDGIENGKNIFIAAGGAKEILDSSHVGLQSQLCYEDVSVFPGYNVLFSTFILTGNNIQYSYFCQDSHDVFGCVSLRNKSYCILNKQYSKDEYEQLVSKIISHMNTMPYTDSKGRVYRYGEFFPPDLSPFAYNETIAQEYFPLTKEQALEQGYAWRDAEERHYTITKKPEELPDHIKDADDSILQDVIGCLHEGKCNEQCTTAFKIIPQELEFYRRMNLPLPRLCPNCRHYQRLKQRNPLKLWHRKCTCAGEKSGNGVYINTSIHFHGSSPCPNEFETSYAPERLEIVYCESCYQAEVV